MNIIFNNAIYDDIDSHPSVARDAGFGMLDGRPCVFFAFCRCAASNSFISVSLNGVTSNPYVNFGTATAQYILESVDGGTGTLPGGGTLSENW